MTNREKMEKYWTSRNERMFLAGEKDILKFAEELKTNYEKCLQEIENQINIFYGKYSTVSGLDMVTVRKLLNSSELKDFKSNIDEMLNYSKLNDLSSSFKNELQLLSIKTRISRLEELKTNINFEIEKLTADTEKSFKDKLYNTYEEGYYRTIFNTDKLFGISASFTALNTKAIEKAIATKYMAENYGDVLGRNREQLKTILSVYIPQGLTLGYNPKKVAQIASKKLNTNYNAAVRLARTEYNLILNDATYEGYKQAGIQQYQLLATLDSRTSEICQSIDGKVYDIKDKEVGVNYPPFHPNCRTTTIAYFERDEIDELFGTDNVRIARDETGKNYYVDANLTYKQWKEGLQEKDGKSIYKNK